MPKTYDKKIRNEAKRLYVFNSVSLEDIARTLKIHLNTLKSWAKVEGWDGLVSLKNANSMQIELHAIEQIGKILQIANEEVRILTTGEVDTIAKLRKLIETTNADAAFASNAIEAMSLFTDFLHDKAPQIVADVSEFVVEFASQIASRHVRGNV